jgi:hypothetical protein
MRRQFGCAINRYANDATAVNPERPLMRARDHDIGPRTLQLDPSQSLRDVDRQDGTRGEPTNGVVQRLPIEPKTVVETDQ